MSEDHQGHERFMHRCIELAREAKQLGNTIDLPYLFQRTSGYVSKSYAETGTSGPTRKYP